MIKNERGLAKAYPMNLDPSHFGVIEDVLMDEFGELLPDYTRSALLDISERVAMRIHQSLSQGQKTNR